MRNHTGNNPYFVNFFPQFVDKLLRRKRCFDTFVSKFKKWQDMKMNALDDEKGFKLVFETYYPRLLRFANSYVDDRFEAENIVQDVFLKLWEKRASLPAEINMQAYLLTMVKNQCMDFLKHQKVVEQHFADWETVQQQEASFNYYAISQFNPDVMDAESVELLVEKAINDLPEQCRKVFELSRYDSLKYKEIAERLGISVKTVESHVSNALKILRITLKDLFPVLLLYIFW